MKVKRITANIATDDVARADAFNRGILGPEVNDLAEALQRIKDAGLSLEYGPVSEPWGVRRFYVRDPLGKLINVMQHE